jgi:hypothetical protein
MVSFRQRKGSLEKMPEEKPVVKDDRLAPGASATGSNVGPSRLPAIDDEAIDPMLP